MYKARSPECPQRSTRFKGAYQAQTRLKRANQAQRSL